MKQLTCEMCGSTNLMKEDGVFICQSCGTKYSIEEAKKMMVEGTVNVQGTVKVDSSDKIKNYLELANNAFDADNNKEAELYCNKIIEEDPKNYEAWLMKGRAAGWQSTMSNVRIEEAVNCFSKAVDNAPKEKINEIKEISANEISRLGVGLVSVACKWYAKNGSQNNAEDVINYTKLVQLWSLKLLLKCGVPAKDFTSTMAEMIFDSCLEAYNNDIYTEFWEEEHPADWRWERYTDRSLSLIDVIKFAINLSEEDDSADIDRWNALLTLYKDLEKSAGYTYSNGSYVKSKQWEKEQKEMIIDWIMEAHDEIKKIDPSHVIPNRPKASSGCYVATAVYGSYDCPQVWTLRRYRDYTLAETWYGRAFIYTYYAISPTLVKWFGHTEWFKNMWRGKLDRMVNVLQSKGIESTPYHDREW